jgi:hypothetical protein
MKEYFRGLIWPRSPVSEDKKPTNYPYLISGLLITDEPLPGIAEHNQTLFDYYIEGLAKALINTKHFDANGPVNVGTIDNFVVSLNNNDFKSFYKPKLRSKFRTRIK